MKAGKIKFIVLLFITLLSTQLVFSENNGVAPIYLYHRHPSNIDGTNRPHKAPQNNQISLTVSYDGDNSQLIFTDTEGAEYCYTVVDANGCVISEDSLYFSNQSCICKGMNLVESGTYTLIISFEGVEFWGEFDVNIMDVM